MALVALVRNRFQRVRMFDGIEKSLKLNKRMEKREVYLERIVCITSVKQEGVG